MREKLDNSEEKALDHFLENLEEFSQEIEFHNHNSI